MNLLLEYIKYRWNAKGRHGVHSPFVYDFVDKCLRASVTSSMTEAMDVLARKLKSDKRIIEIRDFGAGSKKLNTKRKVSDIYRISSSKGRKGRLLNRIVQFYKPGKILELGTSLGIGTISMRTALQNVEVVTVEACTNTRSLALENFEQVGLGGINSIESKFEHYLKMSLKQNLT